MPFTFPHIIKNIIRLVYRKRKSGYTGYPKAGHPVIDLCVDLRNYLSEIIRP